MLTPSLKDGPQIPTDVDVLPAIEYAVPGEAGAPLALYTGVVPVHPIAEKLNVVG